MAEIGLNGSGILAVIGELIAEVARHDGLLNRQVAVDGKGVRATHAPMFRAGSACTLSSNIYRRIEIFCPKAPI
jgi:hypothetical protein